MGLLDDAWSLATAVGNGIYSVGEDMYYGAERSVEGLNFGNSGRQLEIGAENEYLAKLLTELIKHGITSPKSPLFKIVNKIIGRYYEAIPEETMRRIAKQAGIKVGGHMVGRMVIGKTIATWVAKKVAIKIAQTTAYKQFAKKLGVSSAASSTGVGIPITLVMFQGVAQRSSNASKRLAKIDMKLYRDLRRENGLDMLYFLVEKPLAPYMQGIVLANRNREKFIKELEKQLEKAEKSK